MKFSAGEKKELFIRNFNEKSHMEVAPTEEVIFNREKQLSGKILMK